MLAGAGRFDGRVQGQQIGLVGDAGDRLDDFADVGGLFFQFRHHLHRAGLLFGGGADGGYGLGDFRADRGGQGLQVFRLLQREGRRLHAVVDGFRGQDGATLRLLRRARGFLGAGGDLVHGALEFLRRRGRLVDAAGQLPGGGSDALRRLLLLRHGAGAAALGLGLPLELLFVGDRLARSVSFLIDDRGKLDLRFLYECHGVPPLLTQD